MNPIHQLEACEVAIKKGYHDKPNCFLHGLHIYYKQYYMSKQFNSND